MDGIDGQVNKSFQLLYFWARKKLVGVKINSSGLPTHQILSISLMVQLAKKLCNIQGSTSLPDASGYDCHVTVHVQSGICGCAHLSIQNRQAQTACALGFYSAT